MANQPTPRFAKFQKVAEALWTVGLFSSVIGAPIGASQGYTAGGMSGAFEGAAIALGISGGILLLACLARLVAAWGEHHA